MLSAAVRRWTAQDTGVSAGLLVASAVLPGTFEPSLSKRSPLDQGIVTGLSTGLHYLLTLTTQDSLQALVARYIDANPSGRIADPVVRRQTLTALADLAVIGPGIVLQRALPNHPAESVARGLTHQVGWRYAVTGISGALVLGTRAGMSALDRRLGADGRVAAIPMAVPVGLAVSVIIGRLRLKDSHLDTEFVSETTPSALRSMGVAALALGGLTAVGYGEHALSSLAGRRLASMLPGGPELWKLAGHAVTLAALGAGGTAFYGRAMRKVEAGTSTDDPVFESDESTRWTGPTVSGGPKSLVPWQTLGREGRRHVLLATRPTTFADRPEGTPDLSIETVMDEPAKATPVQVYVGLDSAPTAKERVDLAMAEMERLGGFDRSLIMLVSPTGTGYVNYVAVAAAQYLSRGDVTTVTMQYSKRPSPLSLGKVGDAREQNRQLWLRILERVNRSGGSRPRVVVFGESLGAHTSQDVFLHWGTMGPQALGIDRALWIGTPYGSGWMHEVTGPDRLDVDKDTVAVVNDFGQLEALGDERLSRLRYVLLSHDNDGVTKFGTDLLVAAPPWLRSDRPPPQAVPNASPRGIPRVMHWRPIVSFFQGLVDMKNAQLPGSYRAWAHDYRPDLARFISAVFDLPASPEQMARLESVLERRETVREELLSHKPPTTPA